MSAAGAQLFRRAFIREKQAAISTAHERSTTAASAAQVERAYAKDTAGDESLLDGLEALERYVAAGGGGDYAAEGTHQGAAMYLARSRVQKAHVATTDRPVLHDDDAHVTRDVTAR